MNPWITKIGVLVAAALIYLAGQYFRGIWFENFAVNVCQTAYDQHGSFCNSPYVQSFGWPLIAAGQVLAIVGLVLLFANRKGLRKWMWLSLVYLPVSALIIFNIPAHETGVWAFTLTPSREHVTWLLGYIYIFITFIIVAYTRYTARNKVV